LRRDGTGGDHSNWLAHAMEPTNEVVDRIHLTVADLTRPDSPKA
jgi:hypothetical protein